MGVLPYEGQQVAGVIIEAEGYEPSANGLNERSTNSMKCLILR